MEVNCLTCSPPLPATCYRKDAPRDGVVRPLADFHPTAWGEFFIHFVAPTDDQKGDALMRQRVEELKEDVRIILANARGRVEEEMGLVDALQRLGLAYHFENEIDEALLRIHDAQVDGEDLHVVSLRFRLLRQHGYNISSTDEFKRFKDVDGHFRSSLGSGDVKGLLSLYEAAYLGTHEDTVLEEAITFCRRQLESMLGQLQHPLAAEVARSLQTPLIRRMKRLDVRNYISFYAATEGRNDLILELAKLDFNLLQSLHQEEIRDLSLWWKELGIIKVLSFARDRLAEGYIWILGVFDEPTLSRARTMMTKVILLLSVLDDIYDSYGTLDELMLLTNVIQRWDVHGVDELPEYMKIFFAALSHTFKEFEDELSEEGKSYRVEYLKEHLKMLALAYFEEAKWSNKRYVPALEEHLHVSLVTSAYQILTCASFIGMGDIATKDAFDWVTSFPRVIKASTIICRLMDDIVSYEFEQKRQHVASTVQCYMKEYNVSKEKACQKLYEMVEDAWKVMNEEFLKLTIIPRQLLMSPLNLSCMIEALHKHSDGYTHSLEETKDRINLLLVECIQVQ